LKLLGLSTHASEALEGMARFYHVPQKFLLRVIAESYLDAASENGDMQRELAVSARFCQRTGHVLDCWLEMEGERFEDGPDDSGPETYFGNEKTADQEMKQSWAVYGDRNAEWGEADDDAALNNERRASRRHCGLSGPSGSLADAG
jgi:hypothetical protein